MKKTLLTTLAFATINLGALAQNVNIPDANFKASLVGNTSINTNGDTEIQVSEATAFTGQLSLNQYSGVTDLTGLEAFTNITSIQFVGLNITNIDVSQNTALTFLNVQSNNLTSIDVSQNTALTSLYVQYNQISSIDVSSNTNLQNLLFTNNNVTNIDLSNNTNLTYLFCENNDLTQLDVSNNPSLAILLCESNDLTSLNMKNLSTATLTNFNATSNPNLTCIEVDDVTDATTNWTNIDATASFSLNCSALGVSDSELAQKISIYPNPVVSQIHINSDEIIESMDIIDALGNTIQPNITSTSTIDVSNLSKGVYFLKVYTNKGLVSKKLIKN